MARPGVMFYFDIRPCIRRLSLADKGQLFEAILDYAENGIEPELDGALGVAWDFIQPRIDLDSEQYESKVETSQYAAFSRERKKLGLEPIDRDEWRSMTDIERHRAISDDIQIQIQNQIQIFFRPNSALPSRTSRNPKSGRRRYSHLTRTLTWLRAVSATKSPHDCRQHPRRAKSSCKHGRMFSTSVTGWTGTAGQRLSGCCYSRRMTRFGKRTSCPGEASGSTTRRSLRGWEGDDGWTRRSWNILSLVQSALSRKPATKSAAS